MKFMDLRIILFDVIKLKSDQPYPATNFCPETVICFFTSAAYIQLHFRPDFIMEANTMNPYQAAPIEAV